MARLKSYKGYTDDLRAAIKERKGNYELFLEPMVHTTATNWRALDKVTRDLEREGYTITEKGSRGQSKLVAHPLAVTQEKLLRTLRSNLLGLGLSFDIIPDKVNKAKGEDDGDDLLAKLYGSPSDPN